MSINAYETRTVQAAYEQMKKPTTFLRDMFFKGQQVFGTENVDVDIVDKTRRVAKPIVRGGTSNLIDEKGFITKSFKPPLYSDKKIVTAAASTKRLAGESILSPATAQQRMRGKGLTTIMEFEDAFTRSEEYQCYEALFTGHVTLPNGEKIEFGQDPDLLNRSIDVQWGENTATPLKDIFNACEAIHKATGNTPNIVMLGKEAMMRFFADDEIQNWFDKTKMDGGEYVGKDVPFGGKFLGRVNIYGYVLDLFSYYAWYDIDGTDTAYMPSTKAMVIDSDARREKLYGAIESNGALEPTVRHVDSWENKDPDGIYYRLQSAPLMAPIAVDTYATIETTV